MEETQTISADVLTSGESFPEVNENALKTVSENPKTETDDLTGYDKTVHEYPPRKNKRGEWAKRRGNKKGFVFGKSKTEKEIKINIPADETENIETQTENIEQVNALELSTKQASFIISNCFFVGLRVYSDYEPAPEDAQAHQQACYDYLMSTGGVDLPNWATLAVLSAQQVMLASQKPKAKTRLQKVKDWFIIKFYAWKNRKNGKKTDAGETPKEKTEQ